MSDTPIQWQTFEAELARRAVAVRERAYAPYSEYQVGAALLMTSGRIYEGVNIENAAYPNGLCAERAALAHAVTEGERHILAVAVATSNGGMPCGMCRQMLAEFGREAAVLIVTATGQVVRRTTLEALLPQSFGPEHLP